jgi:putative oxidoreductase
MNPTNFAGTGLLVLRVVVGVTFVLHGLDKLSDLTGTEELFASLKIPAPALMAPFVALTETIGALLLIIGLATPLVGAALTVDMLVALVTAHIHAGLFASNGSEFLWELFLGIYLVAKGFKRSALIIAGSNSISQPGRPQ